MSSVNLILRGGTNNWYLPKQVQEVFYCKPSIKKNSFTTLIIGSVLLSLPAGYKIL